MDFEADIPVFTDGFVEAICPLSKISNCVGGTQITGLTFPFRNQVIGGNISALKIVDQYIILRHAFKISIQNDDRYRALCKHIYICGMHLCCQHQNAVQILCCEYGKILRKVLAAQKIVNF